MATKPTNQPAPPARSQAPESVTGVQLAQGIGHRPVQGFWGEAWSQVIRRPGAIFGLSWISVIAFFAVFAPFLASGHPLAVREGGTLTSPLLDNLRATDILLLLGAFAGVVWMALPMKLDRGTRLGALLIACLQAGIVIVILSVVSAKAAGRDASDWLRAAEQGRLFVPLVCSGTALLVAIPMLFISPFERWLPRLASVGLVAAVVAVITAVTWVTPIERYDYRQRQAAGEINPTYTVIPFSPQQGDTTLNIKPPGSNLLRPAIDRFERHTTVRARLRAAAEADPSLSAQSPRQRLAAIPADAEITSIAADEIKAQAQLLSVPAASLVADLEAAVADARLTTALDIVRWIDDRPIERFHLGTDSLGQDVLSQMLHACRLSISIGLVSTLIAVTIGVTVGALMGYFGGWVDLLLYRVVEIFMSIPVLFLLIVAAAVLPRNTYVMMAIIGCVTWTGSARFVRAEFYKLRNQDFVQSARAVGLPLRSILFKHMLPNGVTPVLVDSSFAIAAAILAEATLSYLGLGPANQASWGRLLSDATNQVGAFVWWLAIFPGLAIFLTVLSYNLIGEAFRDAIDPKLKKARV
jgi:ABC-type dipeptide/oligopeptide/nickel transport system permease subunit